MKTKWSILSLIVLLLASLVARAADTDAAAIAPYVDQQTVIVVRVDTASIDINAVRQWLGEGVKAAGNSATDLNGPAAALVTSADKWLADFHKAGGSTLFLVVSFAEQPEDAIFLAAPVKAGADSKAVESALGALKPEGAQSAAINQIVFVAGPRMLDRLRKFQAAPRPDLARELTDAGNAPIIAALVPSDEIRKVFEAMAPKLPQELGGGPITVLTDGLRRASLSLQLPPQASLSFKIQSRDADSAQALATLIRNLIQMARLEAVKGGLGAEFNMLADKLDPQVAGEQISFSLKSDSSSQAAGLFADAIVKARQRAQMMQTASNMRQILIGCVMYAADHHEEFPGTLEAAVQAAGAGDQLLTNPRNPARKPAFVYHKPDAPMNKLPNVSRWVLLYEAYDQWPSALCVGFADGHVEFMSKEMDFKKMLDESTMPK